MRTIKYASKGEEVIRLQEILGIEADGIFGPKTLAAVKLFQREHGLKEDGIVGPMTWDALLIQEDVDNVPPGKVEIASKPFRQPVDYKQYDSRWKNVPYTGPGNKNKGKTIATSGCGVTSAAMILATLVDANITPRMIAPMYMANGFRAESGTREAAFPWTAKKFGLQFKWTESIATAKKWVSSGGYVICHMKAYEENGKTKGFWTKGGHYIVMWKYDDKGIWCNDPASVAKTHQPEKDFTKECVSYSCFIKG